MGADPPPRAGRWRGRERLWDHLARLSTVVVEAHPVGSGMWRVFDPAADIPTTPIAVLSDDDLYDLKTAGVHVVYRR